MNLKKYFNQSLFWDVNFEKMDVDKFPISVVQRVMDRGTDFQREKVIEYYGFDFVRKTMLNTRHIMPFGIYFVLVRLDIPLKELRFFQLCKEMKMCYAYDGSFDFDEYLCF